MSDSKSSDGKGSDKWMTAPPIFVVPSESAFNEYLRQLKESAEKLGSKKAQAVVGVLKGITWQAKGIAAYVTVGKCRGLMEFTSEKHSADIEQWVTAADERGAGTPMLEWLVNVKHATTVNLFPVKGSEAAYENLGFVAKGTGGFLQLSVATSNYWVNISKEWKYSGPPLPPPAS